jgi:hypothetical protein
VQKIAEIRKADLRVVDTQAMAVNIQKEMEDADQAPSEASQGRIKREWERLVDTSGPPLHDGSRTAVAR